MKHLNIILLSLWLTLFAACTVEPEWSYKNTPRGNVEALWNIIDKKYCFVEEKNVDWQAVLPQYLSYADTVSSDRELFQLLADMLDLLHDGHVNLYSDFNVSRNKSWYEGYPIVYNESIAYSNSYLTADYFIAGGMHYQLIDDGRVGLIRYPSFSSGFGVMNMISVLNYFDSCRGIVLDMRSNGGGSIEYARSLASCFFTQPRQVGWWSHKTGEGHYDLSEAQPMLIDTTKYAESRWLRPVVVLTDRFSYSATNYFVNAMHHADNCTILGITTGGGGGMPLSYELPCGWMVRFSSVKMFDLNLNSIEEGIQPDITILQTSADADDLIDAAVSIINKAYNKSN